MCFSVSQFVSSEFELIENSAEADIKSVKYLALKLVKIYFFDDMLQKTPAQSELQLLLGKIQMDAWRKAQVVRKRFLLSADYG